MELPFAVVFKAIDNLSGTVDKIGQRFNTLNERIKGAGEALRSAGERMALAGGLAKEGIGKIREFSENITEPAIDMEHVMATMAATTGIAGEELTKIKEAAIAFSDTHPGTTAEEYIEGFTRLRGIFQDTAKAMQAEGVIAMLGRFGVDNAAATNLVQVAWSNLRTDAKTTGDELKKTIEVYGIAPDKIGQFTLSIGRMGASAQVTNTPLSQLLALGGEANRLLGGGRGGMMFAGMVQQLITATEQGKVAIDFSHGLLGGLKQLRDQVGGVIKLPEHFYALSAKKQNELLEQLNGDEIQRLLALGISNPVQMLNILAHLNEVGKSEGRIGDSTDALQIGFDKATKGMQDATIRLHQVWKNFADSLASPALPTETKWTDELSDALVRLTGITERYPRAAGDITIGLGLMGSGLSYAIQGIQTLGSTMILASYGVKAFGTILDWFRTVEVATTTAETTAGLASIAPELGGVTIAAGTATTALGALGTALLAIAWPVAIIAGIAVASYEIYEHWSSIKTLWASIPTALINIWNVIKPENLFGNLIPEMFDFGGRMIKALGLGILHAIEFEIPGPLKTLGERIMGFFPHSPVKEGPLQDLENITIVETIAAAIRRAEGLIGNTLSGVLGGSVKTAWQSLKSFAGVGAANILHGLMGTESSYGKMLTNPTSSAIGPYQMTAGFRRTWGVTPEQAMSMGTSTEVANKIIFGHYMPEFGGDINKALSAWHQGEGWVRSHGVDNPYVNSVLRHTPPPSPAGGGGVTINVHYAPTIHGATPQDLNKHADHIVKIVKDKLGREARLRYD